ncbi:hypothetical protein RKD26_002143 [Streptomyces calvus]
MAIGTARNTGLNRSPEPLFKPLDLASEPGGRPFRC